MTETDPQSISHPLLCVVGPTGTGKSTLALDAVRELTAAEIVNCDSRQVYADFPCITAQPAAEDYVQCAHHLYGFLPTAQSIHAGRFIQLADETIQDIWSRSKVPIMVGGTGLYLRALLYGLTPIPPVPELVHQRIQEECTRLGPEALHQKLHRVDEQTAARLHPRDKQRITRALEVFEATGRTLSWWIATYPCDRPRYNAMLLGLWAGLDRLTPLLEHRIERMCAAGAIQEVSRAWERCPRETAPGWSGIGCFELLQVVLGRWSMQEAKQTWLKNTRAYAKRQLTWFQKQGGIEWLKDADISTVMPAVRQWLQDSGWAS